MDESPSDSYDVYLTEQHGVRNHLAIFIETMPDAEPFCNSGRLYHVVGTILRGMDYGHRNTPDPELLPGYVMDSKRKIAVIARDDVIRFERECAEEIPPPPAQLTLSGKPLNRAVPLYRCTDWVEDVVHLALELGIFKRDEKEGELYFGREED
ncbi:hypothetical protein BO85DRAFT_103486 [Aspergillus piperis CBS 112811]|uniref:Uncharacterized protein n=1 Tax=Aspergillus piperis CBS 112811 TaxID=1448313 RepID=A0A8G1VIJ0_9EURO|nr:hypothetical protein BO85DRAFT_103486 [Aspergillus piperis CBS 112811]RAH54411.1 hypothetical protein BO85DRAFT_103486 [Aspergillus piperis CBS 112811]